MNRIERLQMSEMFIQLAADAIQRRHPHAAWLVHKQPESMNDATLEAAVERLGVWLADHQELISGTG